MEPFFNNQNHAMISPKSIVSIKMYAIAKSIVEKFSEEGRDSNRFFFFFESEILQNFVA